MSRQIRSRRAGLSAEEARERPLYARVLGLQFLNPSGLLCFLYFEGMVALGVLLALAELVQWWAVLVLPAAVAVMVKLNDMVAGALVTTGSVPRNRRSDGLAAGRVPDARSPRTIAGAGAHGRTYGATAGASSDAPPGAPGATARDRSDPPEAAGPAGVPPIPADEQPTWVLRQVSRDPAEIRDAVDSPRQRFRQAGNRRYR